MTKQKKGDYLTNILLCQLQPLYSSYNNQATRESYLLAKSRRECLDHFRQLLKITRAILLSVQYWCTLGWADFLFYYTVSSDSNMYVLIFYQTGLKGQSHENGEACKRFYWIDQRFLIFPRHGYFYLCRRFHIEFLKMAA